MSVTTLVNTTWILNYSLNCPSGYGIFSINYTYIRSNSALRDCDRFSIGYRGNQTRDGCLTLWWSNSTSADIYIEPGSLSLGQSIISISGGSSATDSNLINWFSSNAKQVLIQDLSHTKWELYSNNLRCFLIDS